MSECAVCYNTIMLDDVLTIIIVIITMIFISAEFHPRITGWVDTIAYGRWE